MNSGIMQTYLQDSGIISDRFKKKGEKGSTRIDDIGRGIGATVDPLLDLFKLPFAGYGKLFNYLTEESPNVQAKIIEEMPPELTLAPRSSQLDPSGTTGFGSGQMSNKADIFDPEFAPKDISSLNKNLQEIITSKRKNDGFEEFSELQPIEDQLTMDDDETFGLTEVTKEPNLTMDDDETFGLTGEVPEKSKKDQEQDKLDELFTSALQSAADAREGQPTKRKTLADYKKEFSDATGIDASGKVDKSGALMALGLALMQNKAGKGFNVGNMLSAVGEAGAKALPVFEKSKQQAKLAAAKAGEYALGKVAEDKATAKLEKEEMLNREQYYVVPKGEKGGPMGAVNSILKGDGEFIRVNKFELSKLDQNQQFNDKFEIVKASDYNSILEEAMKTPEAKSHYNKALADATMFETLDTKFKYYVPSDPNSGYKPLLVRPGEAINQLIRLNKGLETGKSNFAEIAKLVSATETDIPTQIVQSVQQLSRNLGIPITSDVPPITQLRRLLKKMSALRAAEILGETGKTLSDNDRRRVDDIVGEVNFEKADRAELIATLDGLYKTVIGQREKDIAQFKANLGTFGNSELQSYLEEDQQPENQNVDYDAVDKIVG